MKKHIVLTSIIILIVHQMAFSFSPPDFVQADFLTRDRYIAYFALTRHSDAQVKEIEVLQNDGTTPYQISYEYDTQNRLINRIMHTPYFTRISSFVYSDVALVGYNDSLQNHSQEHTIESQWVVDINDYNYTTITQDGEYMVFDPMGRMVKRSYESPEEVEGGDFDYNFVYGESNSAYLTSSLFDGYNEGSYHSNYVYSYDSIMIRTEDQYDGSISTGYIDIESLPSDLPEYSYLEKYIISTQDKTPTLEHWFYYDDLGRLKREQSYYYSQSGELMEVGLIYFYDY